MPEHLSTTFTRDDAGRILARWSPTPGYECIVMVGPMGALNGYVRIPEDHPWFSKWEPFCGHDGCYEHTVEGMIDVHGGITFGGGKPMGVEEGYWIGFDCSQPGDLVPGLDFMYGTYRDERYVRAECERVVAQLVQNAAPGATGEGS